MMLARGFASAETNKGSQRVDRMGTIRRQNRRRRAELQESGSKLRARGRRRHFEYSVYAKRQIDPQQDQDQQGRRDGLSLSRERHEREFRLQVERRRPALSV